jgi:hypothetical protein
MSYSSHNNEYYADIIDIICNNDNLLQIATKMDLSDIRINGEHILIFICFNCQLNTIEKILLNGIRFNILKNELKFLISYLILHNIFEILNLFRNYNMYKNVFDSDDYDNLCMDYIDDEDPHEIIYTDEDYMNNLSLLLHRNLTYDNMELVNFQCDYNSKYINFNIYKIITDDYKCMETSLYYDIAFDLENYDTIENYGTLENANYYYEKLKMMTHNRICDSIQYSDRYRNMEQSALEMFCVSGDIEGMKIMLRDEKICQYVLKETIVNILINVLNKCKRNMNKVIELLLNQCVAKKYINISYLSMKNKNILCKNEILRNFINPAKHYNKVINLLYLKEQPYNVKFNVLLNRDLGKYITDFL